MPDSNDMTVEADEFRLFRQLIDLTEYLISPAGSKVSSRSYKKVTDSLEVQQMGETLQRLWPGFRKQDQDKLYLNAQAVLRRNTGSQEQEAVPSDANIGITSSELLALQHEIILMWEDSQLEFQQHFRTIMQKVRVDSNEGTELRSFEDLKAALDSLF